MVIRILTGKNVAGEVRYNEQKVEKGQADRIQIANYPNTNLAEKHARFRLQLLEQYARLNPGIRKPSLHLAVALHPAEKVTSDELRIMGNELMSELGWDKQPYLMYQHHDTQHPHIHIVTVAVDAQGNRVSDQFIKYRLQQIRRRLEIKYGLVRADDSLISPEPGRVGEGLTSTDQQTMSKQVKQVLENYIFSSINTLKLYLQREGILMDLKAGRSGMGITYQHATGKGANNRPVKASSLPLQPTRARLAELFAGQAERHKKECAAVAALLIRRLSAYRSLTETGYRQSLQQLGIEVIEIEGAYLYVDRRRGLVAQETELGNPFRRQELSKRFTHKTELLPIVEDGLQRVETVDAKEPKAAAGVAQTLIKTLKRKETKAGLSTDTQSMNAKLNDLKQQSLESLKKAESTVEPGGQAVKKEQVERPVQKKKKKIRRQKTHRR